MAVLKEDLLLPFEAFTYAFVGSIVVSAMAFACFVNLDVAQRPAIISRYELSGLHYD